MNNQCKFQGKKNNCYALKPFSQLKCCGIIMLSKKLLGIVRMRCDSTNPFMPLLFSPCLTMSHHASHKTIFLFLLPMPLHLGQAPQLKPVSLPIDGLCMCVFFILYSASLYFTYTILPYQFPMHVDTLFLNFLLSFKGGHRKQPLVVKVSLNLFYHSFEFPLLPPYDYLLIFNIYL